MLPKENPYPEDSYFAVHQGFRPGVYSTYHELKAQVEGFVKPVVFEAFSDRRHAEHFARTGSVPEGAIPIVPDPSDGRLTHPNPPPIPRLSSGTSGSSSRSADTSNTSLKSSLAIPAFPPAKPAYSLPTPSVSPDRSFPPPLSQPSRPRVPGVNVQPGSSSQPVRSRAPPVTPRKPTKAAAKSESDEEGDTESEDAEPTASTSVRFINGPRTPQPGTSSRPAAVRLTQSATTPGSKPTPLGRTLTPGSITNAIRRSMSGSETFPQIPTPGPLPAPTSAPSVSPSRSVAKPTRKPTVSAPTVPLPLSTPDATPTPSKKRMRPCGHCGGTGQMECSDEESDVSTRSGAGTDRKPSKTHASGSGIGGRAQRASGHRSASSSGERRDGKARSRLDKGKGKAPITDRMDTDPTMSSFHKYLIYTVSIVVFADLMQRLFGVKRLFQFLFQLA